MSTLRWPWWVVGIVVGVGLLLSAVMPSLCRSRETANLVKCANNLRQIGIAINQYAQDHGGQYPDSFATLLLTADLGSGIFNCPSGAEEPARGATTREVAADLNAGGHLSYVYAGSGFTLKTVTNDTIIAYEPPVNHGLGTNVLYGDGRVDFMSGEERAAIMAKAPRVVPAGEVR